MINEHRYAVAQNECSDCIFFKQFTQFRSQGHCRRYPPPPKTSQPTVLLTDWCGEYQTTAR